MASSKPLIAIVGKFADANEKFDDETENRARAACRKLGEELAKRGWRIAVYANDQRFIDREVVAGFVEAGASGEDSIVWYRTTDGYVKYPEIDEHEEYFLEKPEASGDWNVPIYCSLDDVHGVILFAGGATVLTVGHVALSRKLPTLPIAGFRGSAREIWKYLLLKSPLVSAAKVSALDRWSDNALGKYLEYLQEQLKLSKDRELMEKAEQQELKDQAAKWDKHVKAEREGKIRDRWVVLLSALFVLLIFAGLVVPNSPYLYFLITGSGLGVAGATGASMRMVYLSSPATIKKKIVLVAGMVTGVVFAMLSHLPQLMQEKVPSFLLPQETEIPRSSRIQYVSAMIVAFMAGLACDSILEQWRRKSDKGGDAGGALPPTSS